MDEVVHEFMVQWACDFIKNKDSFARKIESIQKNKDGFDIYIKFKDKEQFAFVIDLSSFDLVSSKITKSGNFCIFTVNSAENFGFLVQSWKKICQYSNLTLIFANPFSSLDKKWVVSPYTHNRICDEGSLQLGLKSMFEMVETIDEKQLLIKISSNK